MAKICTPKFASGPVNAGEERLLKFLEVKLPDNYYLIPNGEYPSMNAQGAVQYWEYDCIVVAPHAIYTIENKDYRGRLEANDDSWFCNDIEKPNPIKSATFKSKLLAGYLKKKDHRFGLAWVDAIVSLSSLGQNKSGFESGSYCDGKTFLLDDELVDYLMDNDRLHKTANAISSLQHSIVDFLIGSSQPKNKKKTEVCGYIIEEILEANEDDVEYLCHSKFLQDKKHKVRDYALDKAGLSPLQLERHNKLVHNAEMSEESLPSSSLIIKSHCQTSEDGNHYYVISDYMEEHSLRSEMQRNTFTDKDKACILIDLAEALSLAHEHNVIHRNVCPENIYIQADRHAALANFGLSYNTLHEADKLNVSLRMDAFDRGPYTSEEVLTGDYSPSSDVYSFGIIAYELMVGELPFSNYLQLKAKGGTLTNDMLPSKKNANVEEWVDVLCSRTIVEDATNRWSNIEEICEYIKEEAITKKFGQQETHPSAISWSELKSGDQINSEITLYKEVGEGGFSKVFQAIHALQPGAMFAAKIFKEGVGSQSVIDEFNALSELSHPNIVGFKYNGITYGGQFFTLMQYIDGKDIREYCWGDKYFPLPYIYKFAHEITEALVYLHSKGFRHRDIKPENIIYDKSGKFVLIDFNIATDDDADMNKIGTYPYLAPDLMKGKKMQWEDSADTFALGITLYELVSHVYPWPGGSHKIPVLDKRPIELANINNLVSKEFSDFVMKAIETRHENRFTSAKDMLDALEAIGEAGIAKKSDTTYITNTGEEIQIVDYINSLYSQSVCGNAGTRAGWTGNNILDKETYTKTKLDTDLLKAIKAGNYRLLIITGNAGDGKTAFIRQVEQSSSEIEYFDDTHNGAKIQLNGITYKTNYDGSQDESNLKNSDVLKVFFKPFEGLTGNFNQAAEGRIIAINEGRLMDFLESSPEHKHLYVAIDEYFYKEGATNLPEGVMVINLNLRSVTAIDANGDSLLRKQVKALTAPQLWSKCANCPMANRCFINFNVKSLNDSAVGTEIIKRLEWIVRTIVYKREVHITMRDLRSMIAWMLTRDYNCASIPALIQREDEIKQALEEAKDAGNNDEYDKLFFEYSRIRMENWMRYYFNLTAPESPLFPDLRSEDRIVKLLRETDIANVAIPDADRDLYYRPKEEMSYLAFASRPTAPLLDEFNAFLSVKPSYEMTADAIEFLKLRQQTFIRHQYFEGKFDFLKRMPYQSIGTFYDILNKKDTDWTKVKSQLAYAISCSEGCWNPSISSRHLLLSSTRVSDPSGKSYRRFPLEDFEFDNDEKNKRLTEFLEHENDNFIFRSKANHSVQLTVSLDLYEMLYYIQNGFSPSVSDLRGRFIELQVFKNLLASETYTEVIVTNNEKSYYKISLLKRTMQLVVEPLDKED